MQKPPLIILQLENLLLLGVELILRQDSLVDKLFQLAQCLDFLLIRNQRAICLFGGFSLLSLFIRDAAPEAAFFQPC